MATGKKKAKRDIEKGYSNEQFVAKLRRLADCIEKGMRFQFKSPPSFFYLQNFSRRNRPCSISGAR